MLYIKSDDKVKKLDLYVRSGKNVFDGTRGSYTNAGITSIAKSPYVTMNGTGTRDGRALLTASQKLKAGTYSIFIKSISGIAIPAGNHDNVLFYLYKYNEGDTFPTWSWVAELLLYISAGVARYTFTLTEDTIIGLTTYNRNNESYQDFVLAYNIIKGDGSNVPTVKTYEFEAYNASKKLDLYVKDKDGNATKIS